MNKPLLSVCLITYNQFNYIKQAIESVLMQKTSFDLEIIIADDCSTDGTTAIVKEYAAKDPRIRTLIHEKNIGPAQNYLTLLGSARGKYIAYLEGDDYWIDDKKLQVQVDFMEANDAYSLCFHSVYHLVDGKKKKPSTPEVPDTSDINYLLSHPGYITTLSVVYRNSDHIINLLKKLEDCPFGDFITYVGAAQLGLLKYFPKRMGIYRMHISGTWNALDTRKIFEKTLVGYRMLFAELSPKEAEMLKVRYLRALESYFLQDELLYTDEELEKLLIAEMNIQPYVIMYLKQNCKERKNPYHYFSKVPFGILLKSLQYKLLNRF